MADTKGSALAQRQVVEISDAALEELVQRVKHAGIAGVREVLAAYDQGEIDDETRDALIEDIVDELGDAAKRFGDRVLVFPEPAESLSDMAIEAGVEAVEPYLVTGITKIGRAIHELFDRDEVRLLRRIRRKEIALAEAKNARQHANRREDLTRLRKLLLIHFPDAANRIGIRQDRDGAIEVLTVDEIELK